MGVGNLAVSLLVPMAAQRMRSQVTLVVPTVIAIAGRPGRPAVRAARRGGRLGADPRRRPERGPGPRDLLHGGPRAARGGGRVAVVARPGGRLPPGQRRARWRSGCCTRRRAAGPRRSRCCSRSAVVMLVAGLLAARPRMLPAMTEQEALAAATSGRRRGRHDRGPRRVRPRHDAHRLAAARSWRRSPPWRPTPGWRSTRPSVTSRLGIKLEAELAYWFPPGAGRRCRAGLPRALPPAAPAR